MIVSFILNAADAPQNLPQGNITQRGKTKFEPVGPIKNDRDGDILYLAEKLEIIAEALEKHAEAQGVHCPCKGESHTDN